MKLKEKIKYKLLQKTYRKKLFKFYPSDTIKDDIEEMDEYIKEKLESIDLKSKNKFNFRNKRGL